MSFPRSSLVVNTVALPSLFTPTRAVISPWCWKPNSPSMMALPIGRRAACRCRSPSTAKIAFIVIGLSFLPPVRCPVHPWDSHRTCIPDSAAWASCRRALVRTTRSQRWDVQS